jgi:hypothetical protein
MGCKVWPEGRHSWTPWVQERYNPSRDTRVCFRCHTWHSRPHEEGTEMFPRWLIEFEE